MFLRQPTALVYNESCYNYNFIKLYYNYKAFNYDCGNQDFLINFTL